MADASTFPKGRLLIGRTTRHYVVPAIWVALFGFFAWGTLIVYSRFPQVSAWKIQIGIALAAAFALVALWKVPQWQVARVEGLKPEDKFKNINEARRTLAQIIGGIAVLAGFYSTVQNLMLSQRSFELSQKGQITDRLTKAIDQLGALDSKGEKRLEVRLGGIYALGRIAGESRENHWPIMQVLTAYVRTNARREQTSSKATTLQDPVDELRPDVQAAMIVLASRDVTADQKDRPLNLRETDLPRIYLDSANLSHADLTRSSLVRGVFSDVELSWTDFSQADLRRVQSYGKANFGGANFERARLNEAVLSGADLSYANFKEADLSQAHFSGANLDHAFFLDANLFEADFMSATLSNASFGGADLTGAILVHADLKQATLVTAKLNETNFTRADLTGAELFGADLTNARGLEQQQIDSAKGDDTTKLPFGLHLPEAWKKKP